jgi:hypothetical protein
MITIYSKTIVRLLACIIVCLTVASILGQASKFLFGHPALFGLVRLFDVNEENNIPSWYSSISLLFCSVLLGVIATVKSQRRDRFARHWLGLAVLFLLMSVDEAASVHELLIPLGGMFKASGAFLFFWVVPAMVFVVGMLFAYTKFLIALPSKTRDLFLVAGTVFVFGSIGFEMIGAYYFDNFVSKDPAAFSSGWPALSMAIVLAVEELLEMLGVLIFIHCLLSYLNSQIAECQVAFRASASQRQTAPKPERSGQRTSRPTRPLQTAANDFGHGHGLPESARRRVSH